MDDPTRELTLCRATVNIAGARLGDHVLVDLSEPLMQGYLAKGVIVRLEAEAPTPTDEAEQPGDEAETHVGDETAAEDFVLEPVDPVV